MKIGLFYSNMIHAAKVHNLKKEAILEKIIPWGISNFDISTTYMENCEVNDVTECINEFDIQISSTYHDFEFKYYESDFLKKVKENTERVMEYCSKIKSPLLMPVPNVIRDYKNAEDRKKCREMIAQYFSDVTEAGKSYGIKTVVENYSLLRNPFSLIDDISYILAQVPELGYVLDTGNYWFVGEDVMKAATLFADKTVHVHLKDLGTEGKKYKINDRESAISSVGDGIIPVSDVFEFLHKINYDKVVCIELDHDENVLTQILKSARYVAGKI